MIVKSFILLGTLVLTIPANLKVNFAGLVRNIHETRLTNVHKHTKIITTKGKKRVSKIIHEEQGETVTTCWIISATGHHIPPKVKEQNKR